MVEKKVYIELLDEGTTYECEPTVEDVVRAIKEEYLRHDVELCSVIGFIAIHGLSLQDTVKVYAILFEDIEQDTTVRLFYEGEALNLASDEHLVPSHIDTLNTIHWRD